MRNVGALLLALALGTLLPLLGLELAARHGLIDAYRTLTQESNPTLRWGDARNGTVRIVALGDSMGAGREGYPRLLERRLGARDPHRTYEVLNLSVPGVDPSVYYKRWTALGRRFEPDLVLVGLYLGNDIAEFRNPYEASTLINELYYAAKIRSHLGAFVTARLRALRSAPGPPPRLEEPLAVAPPAAAPKREFVSRVNPLVVADARRYPRFWLDALLLSHRGFEDSLRAVLGVARAIDREATAAGARAVFLLIPAPVQVDADYHDFYRRLGFEMSPRLLSEPVVQERISAFFVGNGIRFVDLLPALRATSTEFLYYLNDGHLNPRGTAFVADYLAGTLAKNGWLAAAPEADRR
jgi:hypothetical protein